MISSTQKPTNQDILLATVHNIENVTEVYLNKKKNLITELIHHIDSRISVYQFEFDRYAKESRNFKAIEEQITDILIMK